MQRLAGYGAAPAGCKAEDAKLDLLALIDSGKLDLESPRIAAIVERYADDAGKEKIRAHLSNRRVGG